MKLSEFLADADNPHSEQGNPSVKCNALYKKSKSFNCYLTATQAIQHAQHLLQKAQLILDHGLEDAVVQVWNSGVNSEILSCGLTERRKGPRRKGKVRT